MISTSGIRAQAAMIPLWVRQYLARGDVRSAQNIITSNPSADYRAVLTPDELILVGLGEVQE